MAISAYSYKLPLAMGTLGFSDGTSGKESPSQCRRQKRCRFSPWVRKIPWRREGQPTPVFYLENLMDGGAWQVTVHGATKSQT